MKPERTETAARQHIFGSVQSTDAGLLPEISILLGGEPTTAEIEEALAKASELVHVLQTWSKARHLCEAAPRGRVNSIFEPILEPLQPRRIM